MAQEHYSFFLTLILCEVDFSLIRRGITEEELLIEMLFGIFVKKKPADWGRCISYYLILFFFLPLTCD